MSPAPELRRPLRTAIAYLIVIGALGYAGFVLGGWVGAVLLPVVLFVVANPVMAVVVIAGMAIHTIRGYRDIRERVRQRLVDGEA